MDKINLAELLSFEERFWSKVEKTDDCWLWRGALARGYGRFWVGKDAETRCGIEYAHRVAYKLLVGSIPGAMELDHLCSVKNCVNPSHLELVSHRENLIRAAGDHCKAGHLFDEGNTYRLRGRRWCRKCGAARARHYRDPLNSQWASK